MGVLAVIGIAPAGQTSNRSARRFMLNCAAFASIDRADHHAVLTRVQPPSRFLDTPISGPIQSETRDVSQHNHPLSTPPWAIGACRRRPGDLWPDSDEAERPEDPAAL